MPYHSPQSSKNESESNSQILMLGGIFLSGSIIIYLLFNLLVSTLITYIPPSLEHKLGAVIAPVYEKQAVESPQQKTLNQLLDRLEANLPTKQQQNNEYQVFYIPEDTVNAIAIPGNKVIIYQGLLKEVESENELMMVLGHELGHFAHHDHLRGLGNVLVVRVTIAYLLGDASIFKSIVASSIRAISQAHYSQKQEKQADKFGLELLVKTYGHVAGATDFFHKLSQRRSSNFDFLASHPAPAKRVREIERLIRKNKYDTDLVKLLPLTLQFN
ncbi:MAG: M48 family metallopeptidase [Cyanobacteria bacterium J06621_12]